MGKHCNYSYNTYLTNSFADRGQGYQGAAGPGDTPENSDKNKEGLRRER